MYSLIQSKLKIFGGIQFRKYFFTESDYVYNFKQVVFFTKL